MDIGHINKEIMGLITISLSTYMILYSGQIFRKIAPLLQIFEKKHPTKSDWDEDGPAIDYIVIGLGRFGNNLARDFLNKGHEVVLVDFDPNIVTEWQEEGLKAEYGDAEDPALPSLLPINNTKNIVSTAPNMDTNIRLLKFMKEHDYKGKITVIAHTDEEEEILKKNGANHVLRPFKDAATIEVENLS